MAHYQKFKSVGKDVCTRGPRLESKILSTMRVIADMVGGTLGPGGQPVLIERQENDLPPIVTKDGVTVFRNLGFDDATSQVILEAARDAAVRTASEAGDGTTTATILAEAIVRLTHEYCSQNRRVSPQRITRRLMQLFIEEVEPLVRSLSIRAGMDTEEGRRLLRAVAKVSANGDGDLADAVMRCFELVGDSGNVTLAEVSGPSTYEVEAVDGYPIAGMGYEDSCGKYATQFITDPANQRIYLEKPLFVIYHGKILEIQTIQFLMEQIGAAWQNPSQTFRHNVILVATGFSESVVAQLALNMSTQTTINVVPLLAPMSPVPGGGQLELLEDLCAVTGCKQFDPLTAPLERAELSELGTHAKAFEMTRFRTTVFADEGELGEDGVPLGPPNEINVLERVAVLEQLLKQAASELDRGFLEERIGKLTGGIARLKVIGSSSGEMRERRDRAEDAVCAVRGAIKHGCLPGGGWTLIRVVHELTSKHPNDPVAALLCQALLEPVRKLFENSGFERIEGQALAGELARGIQRGDTPRTYDFLEQHFADPVQDGILDSLPAVLEAIRNALSIASLLGTLGGTVVFRRDRSADQQEARDSQNWLRDAAENKDYVNERPY